MCSITVDSIPHRLGLNCTVRVVIDEHTENLKLTFIVPEYPGSEAMESRQLIICLAKPQTILSL